jgi:hypothetical protein
VVVVVGVVFDVVDDVLDKLLPQPRSVSAPSVVSSSNVNFFFDMTNSFDFCVFYNAFRTKRT